MIIRAPGASRRVRSARRRSANPTSASRAPISSAGTSRGMCQPASVVSVLLDGHRVVEPLDPGEGDSGPRPAGREHAEDAGQIAADVGCVAQRLLVDHQVERPVGQLQVVHVAQQEAAAVAQSLVLRQCAWRVRHGRARSRSPSPNCRTPAHTSGQSRRPRNRRRAPGSPGRGRHPPPAGRWSAGALRCGSALRGPRRRSASPGRRRTPGTRPSGPRSSRAPHP